MCKRITISPVWWWWQCIKRCKKSEKTYIFSKKKSVGGGRGGECESGSSKIETPPFPWLPLVYIMTIFTYRLYSCL
jgi:hypothetical protein